MNSFLCISVRFLQPLAHGRKDGGEPEWPPSPMRLFQSLVAAAAARWNERMCLDYAVPALGWLERQCQPDIVAVGGSVSDNPYLLYIPHNAADQLVSAWKQGDVTKAVKREQKPVRPTHLSGEAVHYLYPLPEDRTEFERHRGTLQDAARSVTHLGWGIDMVAADAKVISQDEADKLSGHRWRVVPNGGTPLRVPKKGTLDDLIRKHQDFLGRLSADGFKPVPPLQCFDVVSYHSPTAGVGKPPEKPVVAFQILAPDASKVMSFSVGRGVRDVAAWVRNATANVCDGWPFGEVAGFVHGHNPSDSTKPLKGAHADARFSYLPLPSIERRGERGQHAGRIRRVLVTAPPGCAGQVEWVRRRLTGHELVREDQPGEAVGLLTLLPASDWVLRQYTEQSDVWSTVTPVLLPGYDDRDLVKAEGLLREALGHAGLPPEVVGEAELELRRFGFRRGVEPAREYVPPDNLKKFPAYHVRMQFSRPVAGPLAIGAGRYRGFGLFARDGG